MPACNDLFTAIEQYDKMNIHYLSVRLLPFYGILSYCRFAVLENWQSNAPYTPAAIG
jgi:hypothetical protein